jgi:uncharacterized RDD family membrane protein YckC
MSTPSSPGWYDDPQDATQLRYFDGVIWTSHTTPRTTRWAEPRTDQTGAVAPGGTVPSPTPGGATGPGWQSPSPQAPNPQFPGTPQASQWNLPSGATGYPVGRVTGDGVPLAGYGLRVAAFLLDWLLQAIVSGVLGAAFLARAFGDYFDEFQRQMDAVESGSQVDVVALMESIDTRSLMLFSALSILVFAVYQGFFLARFGQTPGKMATNISVRLVDRPGRPPLQAVVRRVGLAVVLFVVEALPVIAFLGLLGRVLDLLFPAWDQRRQALHDKAAGTVVVTGRQPR